MDEFLEKYQTAFDPTSPATRFRLGGAEDNFIFYIKYCLFFCSCEEIKARLQYSKAIMTKVWLWAHFPRNNFVIWKKALLTQKKHKNDQNMPQVYIKLSHLTKNEIVLPPKHMCPPTLQPFWRRHPSLIINNFANPRSPAQPPTADAKKLDHLPQQWLVPLSCQRWNSSGSKGSFRTLSFISEC